MGSLAKQTYEPKSEDYRMINDIVEDIVGLDNYSSNTANSLYVLQSHVRYSLFSQEELKYILFRSRNVRPTWYNTHLLIAHATTENTSKIQHLNYAKMFGNSTPKVVAFDFNMRFDKWDMLDKEEKINLILQFLSSVQNYNIRLMINHTIGLSIGSARMCNLLKFNEVYLPNCKFI
ncbi:hypothetical protein [Vibrio sp. SCSIO 43136]|uniref:hypothetical protein n=1 Tax=Vibrio sp. SCSIO 43136 TaxID=2819101 RepID=UPI0020764336|nr:hypothetical protein [Vibrio sp. SCSIO 43136]USD67033.1 hypothetical protein J4N39_20570 [Vibrio sp. SCSIO 43136]